MELFFYIMKIHTYDFCPHGFFNVFLHAQIMRGNKRDMLCHIKWQLQYTVFKLKVYTQWDYYPFKQYGKDEVM